MDFFGDGTLSATYPIQELSGGEIRHCTTPFRGVDPAPFNELETLPYSSLGGPGLERLVYELLVSKGYEPRFFGRNGQAQFGVDLVAEHDGGTEIHQCKNLARPPSGTALAGYLDMFAKEWLGAAGLPRPNRFVICCPQPLRDTKTEEQWLRAKETFRRRTGVEARLWNLDLLNAWLKRLPDVVADLFSDRHAEAFCGIDDWKSDLFTPVRSPSGDRRLRRYFESKAKGRLYVDERRKQEITKALSRSPVILIRGLPGTGKTFTALAVAEGLAGARQRAYFVDVGDEELTKAALRDGIRSRLSRPSVFVLENCHDKPGAVATALEDLAPQLKLGQASIVCLARRIPGPLDSRSDDSELFSDLVALRAAVDFKNDEALLRRVIEFWRLDFAGMTKKRLSRLAALCGSDLFLLDEVLTRIESPSEIDSISSAGVYEMIRRVYLRLKTASDYPATRRLAALTQFEVHPRADVLIPSENEVAMLDSFCLRAGRPPRWHFLHSTAAELVLHSLWYGMGVVDPGAVVTQAAIDIIDYFRELQDGGLRPSADAPALETDLLRVVTNRLKLVDRADEKRLKAAVLDSEPVASLLQRLGGLASYPDTIARCAFAAHNTGATSTNRYAGQLLDLLRNLLTGEDTPRVVIALNRVGSMLHTLEMAAPELYAELSRELDPSRILDLIETNGTILELFRIGQYFSPDFALRLVQALDEARIGRLVDKTMATSRSIGTLDLTLCEVGHVPAATELTGKLARKIGPLQFLRLIESNGTIFELLAITRSMPTTVARGMVEALDESRIERLTEKTIALKRSVGTLNLFLRNLLRREETQSIGQDLVRKIGPARFLRMIEANGTIYELFKHIDSVSETLARGLVECSSDAQMGRLIDKTIAAGRSIGTLNITLRSLRRNRRTRDVANALEEKIGIAGFWKLIVGAGSPGPLVDLLQEVTPRFHQELLGAARNLTQEQWESVLARGDVFQLSELIAGGGALLQEGAGGARLLAAIETQVAGLVGRATWYQRASSSRQLAATPGSPVGTAISAALAAFLDQVDLETLSFSSASEAVDGVALLYQERPEARALLARKIRKLIPPPQLWDPQAKQALGAFIALVGLVGGPEFSEDDAVGFVAGVMASLKPRLIAKCAARTVLWTLWAVFAFHKKRNERLGVEAPGQDVPAAFTQVMHDSLLLRMTRPADAEEWRGRFGLAGLLRLLGQPVDPSILTAFEQELERHGDAGAWWLCANQPFIIARLILYVAEPAVWPGQRLGFERRLRSALSEYAEPDAALEYLARDVVVWSPVRQSSTRPSMVR